MVLVAPFEDRISELRNLEDDWDSYGSTAMTAAWEETVRDLIGTLPQLDGCHIDVMPWAVHWQWKYIEIEFAIDDDDAVVFLGQENQVRHHHAFFSNEGEEHQHLTIDDAIEWFRSRRTIALQLLAEATEVFDSAVGKGRWTFVDNDSWFRPFTFYVHKVNDPWATRAPWGFLAHNFRAHFAFGDDDHRAFFDNTQIVVIEDIPAFERGE